MGPHQMLHILGGCSGDLTTCWWILIYKVDAQSDVIDSEDYLHSFLEWRLHQLLQHTRDCAYAYLWATMDAPLNDTYIWDRSHYLLL